MFQIIPVLKTESVTWNLFVEIAEPKPWLNLLAVLRQKNLSESSTFTFLSTKIFSSSLSKAIVLKVFWPIILAEIFSHECEKFLFFHVFSQQMKLL